ncbi:hypothetical protein CC1G_05094 [Coprinopsis cinerea okayama7|uniref:Uncharacterized protein n=1 Tax=Coprinopsis cinerea (strain Okayama-7 / 130 / ATCC MYA-4618 / FGSC 9003) TaxID=240176 RepID=A8NGB2_COPC7|nr:hypothetical protein CC1G_05094 [Coprinopsis cinerea okayama7\|eukprot:XP_001833394.1 hypothetical protein CC1G_05094 [Coprinopsis cinerea okayama7\
MSDGEEDFLSSSSLPSPASSLSDFSYDSDSGNDGHWRGEADIVDDGEGNLNYDYGNGPNGRLLGSIHDMFSTGKPAPVEGHPHQWDQGIPSTSQASAKRVYGSTSSHELDPVWHTQSLTFPSKRRSSYVQGTNV